MTTPNSQPSPHRAGRLASLMLTGACSAALFSASEALATEHEGSSHLELVLRLQPELIHASGDRPDARSTDGWAISDGWAGSNTNSAGWGALVLRGHHEVHPGLKMIAELGLNIDAEGLKDGASATREAFVGLKGDWGQVIGGRLESPYRLAGLGWDPLNATFMQARGNLGRTGGLFGHAGNFNSAVEYASPAGPVQFRGFVAFDSAVTPGDSSNDHTWSFSVSAPVGPVDLIFSHIEGSEYRGGPDNVTGSKLSARYANGPFAVSGSYERRDSGLEDGDFLFGTVSYRWQDWTLAANAGHFNDDGGASNDGMYFAFGGRYHLSDQVSVHTGLQYNDRDIGGDELVLGVGLRILLATGNLIR